LKHVCGSFNFVISNKSDILWYSLCKYHLHLGVCTHCNWINVKFGCWTRYSIKYAMCHRLTALTNLFLLINICSTSKSYHSDIHLWLNAQLWDITKLEVEASPNLETEWMISSSTTFNITLGSNVSSASLSLSSR
jgi:hypothetical protein